MTTIYDIKNYDQGEKDNENVGKYVLIFLIVVLLLGILRISWWSFEQTRFFFLPYDNQGVAGGIDVTISYSLAIIFQYGQNPAWFLILRHFKRFSLAKLQLERAGRNPSEGLITHYRSERILVIFWVFLFIVCATVDAGTNLIMVNRATNMDILSLWVMRIVAFAVVFVEEFFMKTLSVLVGLIKDVRTGKGFRKLPVLSSSKDEKTWAGGRYTVKNMPLRKTVPPKYTNYHTLEKDNLDEEEDE